MATMEISHLKLLGLVSHSRLHDLLHHKKCCRISSNCSICLHEGIISSVWLPASPLRLPSMYINVMPSLMMSLIATIYR